MEVKNNLNGNNTTVQDISPHPTGAEKIRVAEESSLSASSTPSVSAKPNVVASEGVAAKQVSVADAPNVSAAQVGAKPKTKRNSFSKAQKTEHKACIIDAVHSKKSLAILRHKLGLSKAQLRNYIADLAVEDNVSFEGYVDTVVPAAKLASSIAKCLKVEGTKKVVFQLTMQEDGILVTAVTLD